jgi:hypothetical protein
VSDRAPVDLVLLHPPAALPCEPPVGIAMLARRLRALGLRVEVIDVNLEALETLLSQVGPEHVSTAAERRALRSRERALAQLRSRAGFANIDRHASAVLSLRRLLSLAGRQTPSTGIRVDLADYEDPSLSPMRSADLLASAARHEASPYAPCFAALAERLAASAPRAVGLSINYLHQALPALALAGAIGARLPGVPVLAGGGLIGCFASRLSPFALRPAIDRLVFDDGVSALLEAVARSELAPPAPSPGRRPAPLAAPDYAGLPLDRYLSGGLRIVPVATSRSCYWGACNYCPEAAARRPFSSVPRSRLDSHLALVEEETRPGLLHLTDSALPPATLVELASRTRRGAPWYGFARVGTELARPEVARGLARSGCVMLQLGLESASERVQARLRKGFSPALASEVLRCLAGEGIAVYLYILFGTPGETREDALRTLEFVERHAPFISHLNTSLLNLPVSSPEEPGLRRVPLEGPKDLSLYTGFFDDAPASWDRRAARRFLEREFGRVPPIAEILRRTPKVFGANHAPLLLLTSNNAGRDGSAAEG